MTRVTIGYAGPYPHILLPVNCGFFRTKRAQEHPKRMRNGWDTLKWMFYQYLIHFSSVLSDIGIVLKLAGTEMRTHTCIRAYPLSWLMRVWKPMAFTNKVAKESQPRWKQAQTMQDMSFGPLVSFLFYFFHEFLLLTTVCRYYSCFSSMRWVRESGADENGPKWRKTRHLGHW